MRTARGDLLQLKGKKNQSLHEPLNNKNLGGRQSLHTTTPSNWEYEQVKTKHTNRGMETEVHQVLVVFQRTRRVGARINHAGIGIKALGDKGYAPRVKREIY